MYRTRRGVRLTLTAAAACMAFAALVTAACGSGTSVSHTSTAITGTPAVSEPVSTRAGSTTSASNAEMIASDVGKADKANLTGAGSTFAAPLYTRWFSDYQSNVASGVKGNYQAIGSGAGIQNISNKTVDFGATDAPMSDSELAKAPASSTFPPHSARS